jgi:hypothetical protein
MLEPKTQTIPFKAGIDRRSDANATEAAGFLQLDNCVFDQDGAVLGRPVLAPQTKIGSTATGRTFLRNADAIALARPQPYVTSRLAELFPGQRVVSVEAAFHGRYTAVIMSALKEDETHAWYQTFTPVTFIAILDSDGQILTLQEIATPAAVSSLGTVYNPKVVALPSVSTPTWLITGVRITSNDLYGATLTYTASSNSLSYATPFLIGAAAGSGKRSSYDVVSDGASTAYVAYATGTGVVWKSFVGASMTLTTTATAFTTFGNPTDVWVELQGSNVHVMTITGTSPNQHISAVLWTNTGGAASNSQRIASSVTLPGLVTYFPTTGIVAWNSSLTQLNWATLTYSGNTTPLTAVAYPSMLIASRAVGSQMAVYNPSGWTSGYNALDLITLTATTTAPLVTARLAYDDFAPFQLFTASGTADDTLGRFAFYQPRFASNSSTLQTYFPALVQEANGAAESSPVDSVGVIRRVRMVAFATTDSPIVAALGRNMLVAGSIPTSWDGVKLTPAAALTAPEQPGIAPGAAGALTGVYSIRTVIEFVDARGVSWFSPPSVASTAATLTAQKKTCTAVVNARLMAEQAGKWKQFRVRFYSTLAGGSTYYLMSMFVMDAAAFFGDLDSSISYDDNTSDGTLALAEQLYSQTSDAFELAPPLAHICAHGNRFFGVRSDVPEIVMFTDEAQEGFLPRWNGNRFIRVDNGAGPALACGSLNDSLVIFQAEQLCLIRGDGPTAAISDTSAYPVPQRFASVGVHPSRIGTIVSTAAGIFFVGRRNAYLLQPDLQVVPVGSALGGASAWVNGSFTRARYVASRNQVWLFGTASGFSYGSPTVQILDLNSMRWTTLSGMSTSSPAGWTDAYDVIEAAGTTYVAVGGSSTPAVFALSDTTQPRFERRNTSSTVDVPVVQTIDLPWFRPSEATDMRLRKVLISGRQVNGSGVGTMPNITVKVFVQSARSALASDTAVHTDTWTGSSLTIAESFQLAFRSITQRCHAFRVQIIITPTATSQPIALNAVTYLYGITGPAGKVPVGTLPSAT